MSSGQAGRFGLAGATNAVELRPRGSQEALTRALFAIPGVASVEPGSAVPDAVRSYMDEFLAILRITQTVTLLLAVLIAVNTMSIATEERRREHATMLAFGTPPRSILRNAVVESALIGALGTVVGLALGLAILGWIVNVVSRDTYPELGLPITLSPASLATAAAVGIVAVGLSPLLGARRLERWTSPPRSALSNSREQRGMQRGVASNFERLASCHTLLSMPARQPGKEAAASTRSLCWTP